MSRIIAVADTYDVMTARDSYRESRVSPMRRSPSCGACPAPARGHLVETFVELLEQQDLSFGHNDDADFEAELAFERRVRTTPRRSRLAAA